MAKTKAAPKSRGKLVVVRTYGAGVHVGELVRRDGQDVTLNRSRRLWRWRGANTLSEVATKGVSQDYTRLSEPVDGHELQTAIEVLPVSPEAVASLTTSRWAD